MMMLVMIMMIIVEGLDSVWTDNNNDGQDDGYDDDGDGVIIMKITTSADDIADIIYNFDTQVL